MQIDECSGTFIRNNHQTWSENVLEEAGTIRKVGSTINSSYHFHAWLSHSRRESGAAAQCILSRLGAGEAARLAPAEEACGLAVLEAVLGNRVVALRATSAFLPQASCFSPTVVASASAVWSSALQAPVDSKHGSATAGEKPVQPLNAS